MTRKRQKAAVQLIEFARPRGWWPNTYSIEMAFAVFHWMGVSGKGYVTPGHWVNTSVASLLGAQGPDNAYGTPIASLEDLRERFQNAFFAPPDPCVDKWRADHGINVYNTLDLKFPHYKPGSPPAELGFTSEVGVRDALKALLVESAGQSLATSLNSIHKTATVVHKIDIMVVHQPGFLDGFSIRLHYGFKTPAAMKATGDSEWHHRLASTRPGESFLDVLARAMAKFKAIQQGTWVPADETAEA